MWARTRPTLRSPSRQPRATPTFSSTSMVPHSPSCAVLHPPLCAPLLSSVSPIRPSLSQSVLRYSHPLNSPPFEFRFLAGRLPGRHQGQFIASSLANGQAVDTVTLRRGVDGFNPPLRIDVGIFAWADTAYSLVANVGQGACSGSMEECAGHQPQHALTLQPGRPLFSTLDAPGQ